MCRVTTTAAVLGLPSGAYGFRCWRRGYCFGTPLTMIAFLANSLAQCTLKASSIFLSSRPITSYLHHILCREYSPPSHPRGLIGCGPALVRFRGSAPILGNFAVFLHPVLDDADVCSPSGSMSISESSAQSHVDALHFLRLTRRNPRPSTATFAEVLNSP